MFFFFLLFSIPIYGFLIWGINDPDEIQLVKWRYKNFPKSRKIQLVFERMGYIFLMIVWTLILIIYGIDAFTPGPYLPTYIYEFIEK